MAVRIECSPTIFDPRGGAAAAFFNSLGLDSTVRDVTVIDCYTVDKNLTAAQTRAAAQLLTNPLTERSPASKPGEHFEYALEIAFLPGVTDNVGATARQTIADGLKILFADNEHVYSSQVLLVSMRGKGAGENDVQTIADALHNPLIQRARILSFDEYKKHNGFAPNLPKVALTQNNQTATVDLNMPDDELAAIGKLGIIDPATGGRRGPLALDVDELKAIRTYFHKQKRAPTDVELESLAQTWSEHCKHTIFADPLDEVTAGLYRHYIKRATSVIRERLQKTTGDFCVSVFSDNAGGIIFDDKHLVTHKVETHNTPSALDPFGGAITGIVGVNRDCLGFGLGAKPAINTYGFCVGPPDDTTTLYRDAGQTKAMLSARRIFAGVINGVNAGGNQSGIPTQSGFVYFDERFRGKPLVFAGTVGLIPRKVKTRPSHVKYSKPGDYIVMLGGRVGLDGIHGATFSSEGLDKDSPATAVQIGDPITQKKLSDALVKEARDQELFSSITDCGAGGLSSAVGEMAQATNGCAVQLDKVPVKYPGLAPWQVWISESQERMVLAVPRTKWRRLKQLMDKRGVEATVIGSFTNTKRCVVTHHNATVMDLALDFLHDGRPIRYQTSSPPQQNSDNARTSSTKSSAQIINLPAGKAGLKSAIINLLRRPNITSFSFISQQYDHEVQGGSTTKPLQGKGRVNSEATVTKPVLTSAKGVVLAHGLYPRYADHDSYRMAAASIDSAVRAAVCAGAPLEHLAILDNFCWYSGNEPKSLYKLKEAAKACFDTATCYNTPFISGKDSMFNDFKGFDENGQPVKISIPPTLLISTIGVMQDTNKAVTIDVKCAGDYLYVLGETYDELGGTEYESMYSEIINKKSESNVPKVDTKKNFKLYQALQRAIEQELTASAIALSRGGLAAALMKTLIAGQLSARVDIGKLPGDWSDTTNALFSESQGRVLVSIAPDNAKRFEKLLKHTHFARIGEVTENKIITIDSGSKTLARLALPEATKAYRETFKTW